MSVGDAPETFAHAWRARVLAQPPLIAPARQYTYPLQIAGEEDALARGALLVEVQPAAGGTFLATCALGFSDTTLPSGIYSCPNPLEMCAVAGGYAYVIDTGAPERSTHLGLKPVAEVLVMASQGLLVFVGFHAMVAWGADGVAWQTQRLSWEGVRVTAIEDQRLLGFGWDLMTDKEVGFVVDLRTGAHTGGGFPAARPGQAGETA